MISSPFLDIPNITISRTIGSLADKKKPLVCFGQPNLGYLKETPQPEKNLEEFFISKPKTDSYVVNSLQYVRHRCGRFRGDGIIVVCGLWASAMMPCAGRLYVMLT